MRILVVHEVNYLEKVIYEIHEFPELLALRGHEITFFDFNEGRSKRTFSKFQERTIRGRVHQNSRINLVTPSTAGPPGVDRLWSFASSIPALLRTFRRARFDVVLNYAVPTYGLQVLLISKMFGVPVVHRALDVSSEIRESIWNPLIAIWERLILRGANSISANNPAMSDYVQGIVGGKSNAGISVDYPPLDLEISSPRSFDSELALSVGIRPQDKVIMYMGSFFYFSGLPEVLRELAPSLRDDFRLKLLLIGGGEQEDELRGLSESLGILDQVVFTGFIAFKDLSRYMSLADVAINPLLPEQVASVAFPQKVLQYMATGIPVVSTQLRGLTQAFQGDDSIVWAAGPSEVARKALDLVNLGAGELKHGEKAVPSVLERLFSPSKAADSLEHHLERASNESKGKRKWQK